MSDNIKLIVEIPKEDYEFTKGAKTARVFPSEYYVKLILNGIPLDDVKTEIENRSYGIANDSVIQGEMYERRAVLKILDNIGKESGDKNGNRTKRNDNSTSLEKG